MASARRGYLPPVGTLILIIVVTQIVTSLGGGAWFPYAAPGLWLGLGGPGPAASVGAIQLILALPVAAAGVWATTRWWARAQLT